MNLKWHELTTPADPYLSTALDLYEAEFDEIVREPRDILLRGMHLQHTEAIRPNAFHFLIGLDTDDQDRVVALTITNYLSTANRGFIVYLAVHPGYRSHGLGGKLLHQLELLLQQDAARAGHAHLDGLVLETENDTDYERRRRFFERQGFQLVPDILYYQPALHPTTCAVPLKLFVKGPPDDLHTLIRAMYEEKYHLLNQIPLATLHQLLPR
ncbi:GNAT family N-acetyltransferase [Tumebacillus sp. ITR2]|uniref:GNAT family N-acetyltransferase n=1 Tax=Tumebacillus amylolyticus TaxID=2801339 RepID=A0ABS1J484_9BACL|nr:GNAT family N-acetyltransferase [Tumebacillus amylolyticus]MBL0385079.1 GNAT family N-acetyltransferase [Tumebacillus amylolyticus]